MVCISKRKMRLEIRGQVYVISELADFAATAFVTHCRPISKKGRPDPHDVAPSENLARTRAGRRVRLPGEFLHAVNRKSQKHSGYVGRPRLGGKDRHSISLRAGLDIF